jgi:hypothetical protein
MLISAKCEVPLWKDLESLLGKPVSSKEVTKFLQENHLNGSSTNDVGGFSNVKQSPIVLCYRNYTVSEVQVALWKYDFMEVSPYSEKLPHGLQHEDTFDIVVRRLGQPTRQAFHNGVIETYYPKVRLAITFDQMSRQLRGIVVYDIGIQPHSRLLE